jgi:hypothetical protein
MFDFWRQLFSDRFASSFALGAFRFYAAYLGQEFAALEIIIGCFERIAGSDRSPLDVAACEKVRSAQPSNTADIFHARSTESPIPVFMPKPPVGTNK